MTKGIGGHHRGHHGRTNEWLTPPEIIEDLGPFDLDPCASVNQPWPTAHLQYTVDDNGLAKPWHGRVWLNPPYGPETSIWLARLSKHGNGIALIFARTETEMFHNHVWKTAHAVLFLKGRLHFHHPDGSRSPANAGAPSVLVAYGPKNVHALQNSSIQGQLLHLP